MRAASACVPDSAATLFVARPRRRRARHAAMPYLDSLTARSVSFFVSLIYLIELLLHINRNRLLHSLASLKIDADSLACVQFCARRRILA